MYIRTSEGPAQGTLQYTLGDPPAPRCQPKYRVTHFLPGSKKLLPLHLKLARDIAKHLFRFVLSEKTKAGIAGKADTRIVLHFEGHVDKKTDPRSFGTLDMDRASEVATAISNALEGVVDSAKSSLLTSYEYSAAGTQQISADSRRNRGVVVCLRSIKVEQASP
jgi:hypothetical protein